MFKDGPNNIILYSTQFTDSYYVGKMGDSLSHR